VAIIHFQTIVCMEDKISHWKMVYYSFKSGMKDLLFFEKFNCSQISHAMEGVSFICFM
jgi:hypothetical protein